MNIVHVYIEYIPSIVVNIRLTYHEYSEYIEYIENIRRIYVKYIWEYTNIPLDIYSDGYRKIYSEYSKYFLGNVNIV